MSVHWIWSLASRLETRLTPDLAVSNFPHKCLQNSLSTTIIFCFFNPCKNNSCLFYMWLCARLSASLWLNKSLWVRLRVKPGVKGLLLHIHMNDGKHAKTFIVHWMVFGLLKQSNSLLAYKIYVLGKCIFLHCSSPTAHLGMRIKQNSIHGPLFPIFMLK